MKYPKYPRSLDRRCKLSLRQINGIKKLYSRGWFQYELAEKYGVTQAAICYVLCPEEVKKRRNRLKYKYHKDRYFKYTSEQRKEIRKRKRRLQLKEIRRYYKARYRICIKRKKDERVRQ